MSDLYDLSSYKYELPPERIAQYPASPRDSSKLLIWNVENDSININNYFRDIINYLTPNDLLILNDTRVIPARLNAFRDSGGKCEILLLKNLDADFITWEALVKPAKKLHEGSCVNINNSRVHIIADKPQGIRIIKFDFDSRERVMKFLDESGRMPLPPYIKNDSESNMRESYQTVFAKNDGSAAAPTASLHFTPELLDKIKYKGVKIAYITLHVGLGTFRPVKTHDIRDHNIHTEHCEIPEITAQIINEHKSKGGRIIACGTTAARTLESFSDENNIIKSGILETKLFIYPGYKFKIVDGLITNFHLPESSLIMLVSSFAANRAGAFTPEENQKILSRLISIYELAIKNNWRFFSFGDAMFII
ncbi:MAG: tRNA preQ1(34) S-adenosylmethionine ribosyltransferase-isomerase QueA [Synergistaceae bacterium]|nr:tRNA preQ1(34) S-adenosylmethionine ribosyltransferase-isomerase QueA [Synergistaceae bacterium]